MINADTKRKKAALAILEQLPSIIVRIKGLRSTVNHLKRHNEMLTRKDVRLSDRTQQHQHEILDELQQMIDEYEQQQQSIISIISSINKSTKTDKDCQAYLFFRYAEGLNDDQIAKVMHLSADYLKRKRAKALLLFADALESMDTDALTQASRTTYTKQ